MRAYLIERRRMGSDTNWTLVGIGFYNPAIRESAEDCCAKWNESAGDPYTRDQAETVALRYEYRVGEYASV